MRRRREMAIELTPLLDVIMIILFLILTRNAGNVKDAREQAAQEMASVEEQASSEVEEMKETVEAAEAAAEEAQEELSALEGRVQSLEVFEEYAVIVSIQVEAGNSSGNTDGENKPSATDKAQQTGQAADNPRKLIITCGEKTETVTFSWSTIRYAENRLNEILKNYFDEAKGMPCFVVFTYQVDQIYKNDFDMITSVLSNLASDNIYVKTVEK